MPNNQDICPISDTGTHRYFIYKVVDVFEPIVTEVTPLVDLGIETNFGPAAKKVVDFLLSNQLYQKVEYALMGCNCGSAIKKKVEQR